MKQVIIYTDGACRGNPGPGGWGALIRLDAIEKAQADAKTERDKLQTDLQIQDRRSREWEATQKSLYEQCADLTTTCAERYPDAYFDFIYGKPTYRRYRHVPFGCAHRGVSQKPFCSRASDGRAFRSIDSPSSTAATSGCTPVASRAAQGSAGDKWSCACLMSASHPQGLASWNETLHLRKEADRPSSSHCTYNHEPRGAVR